MNFCVLIQILPWRQEPDEGQGWADGDQASHSIHSKGKGWRVQWQHGKKKETQVNQEAQAQLKLKADHHFNYSMLKILLTGLDGQNCDKIEGGGRVGVL